MAAVDEPMLVERYVDKPRDPAEARLLTHGMHVWAIVDHLRISNGDVAHVAAVYRVPVEAVRAARAYYERHKAAIDAYILTHAA